MRSLRIVTPGFKLLGEIAGHTSLTITRRHYGVGEFQLSVPWGAAHAEALAIDCMLAPDGEPHKTLLIEGLVYEESKAAITVRGCTLDGIAKRRLAVPPPAADGTFGWDRVPVPGALDVPAETVLKHFARNNLADPPDQGRAVPYMAIAPDLGRGISMRGQARFEQLDALLHGLAEYADMGWTIAPDFAEKRFVFDVVPGRDLAVGNPGATHVILSAKMGNVSEMAHTLDAASLRNTAYVGGNGEDELRLILAVGDGFEGLARRETWVDGGNLEMPEELVSAGKRRLTGTDIKNTMHGTALIHGAFQYGRDFDLGDRVTLLSRTGRLDARVIEARELYEAGKPDAIQLTFGEAPITLASVVRGMQGEVRR